MTERLSYVLPLRTRAGDLETDELTRYLEWLSARTDLIVVDGSEPMPFQAHRERWGSFATHVPPDDDIRAMNGKVRGVLTGLRLAEHDRVVLADDDVRYDDDTLERMSRLLREADLVRPQNYFDPLPWHARWDTARTLMNRALGNDYPGTMGVRRSFLSAVGGYDGDVLFENLELLRTVKAAGGRVVNAPSLFVRRRPPTLARFLEQRPRQAYDDWAQPSRLAAFLAAGPAILALARFRPRGLVVVTATAVSVASVGRFRHDGRQVFDRLSPLLVPVWIVERAVLAWGAVYLRLARGGCPYGGGVIRRAANPARVLRRRLSPRPSG